MASSAPFFSLDPSDGLAKLESRREGLTQAQAAHRLKDHGPNRLKERSRTPPLFLFFRQFLNPLVYILVAAATIKAVVKGPLDALVIVGVLFFMAVVGFIQEMRAETAMEALKRMAAPRAKVRREGTVRVIEAHEVVPGDIIVLESGDKVAADARLLEAVTLKADESALTGESLPVPKDVPTVAADALLAERRSMVHLGTSITQGRGVAVVTATGMATEIGRIAEAVRGTPPQKTSLQKSIDHLGHSLIWIVLAACVLLAIAGVWQGIDALEVFLIVVAAAVAAIPESLPAVVTVVLAVGMQRMARHQAIIRRLMAVETLGAATVICSDKTGTLTMNQMTVRRIYVPGRWIDVSGRGYDPDGAFSSGGTPLDAAADQQVQPLLCSAALCADASLVKEVHGWAVVGDPTEGALVVLAQKAGLSKHELDARYPRSGEIPFDSERQYMATRHRDGDRQRVHVKGSLEKVLPMAADLMTPAGPRPLTEADRAAIQEASAAMARQAMRVLAVAAMDGAAEGPLEAGALQGRLVLLGLCGMIDPPREDARMAVAACHQGGVRVIMATGDHPLTAAAIGEELGLDSRMTLTGRELAQLTDDELREKVRGTGVFARIEPLHKLRIIRALQANGQVVAMTGDGVNDAPALEAADIGVAMGSSGTDVAREASDMVLSDDRFATIVTAVEEGRAIFNRLRNVIFFMLATCFGELLALMLSVLFIGHACLVPLQILWVNLVTGALMAIPLGLEPGTGDELKHPPRDPRVGLIYPGMIARILLAALMLGVGACLVFAWAYPRYEMHIARTMTFCSIVVFEWLVAFNARSDRHTIFRLGVMNNRPLFYAVLAGIALQFLVIHVPLFHEPFETAALDLREWGIALLPGVVIAVAETVRKMAAPDLFGAGKWRAGA